MEDPRLPTLAFEGRSARVVLRDAARRNALDAAALRRLHELLAQVRHADPDAVVLSGEGSVFCAGFDLSLCADEPARTRELLDGLAACVGALRGLDMPVVARVQGAALAGGCALLTSCDFVVVAADALVGYPVHRIGISPAVSATTLFSRMGPRARELMMLSEPVDGRRALAMGLATHCVEGAEALDAEVAALVTRLLAKGPQAMRATKRWMRAIEERDAGELGPAAARDADAMRRTLAASNALVDGEEFATMLRAFWSTRAKGR
ncbi:MAG: enoyl-CoA hydratase/isomerase family protein [Planctomycetaceae bacterium]|nr:enoyl-CoA hydratase/isomerase family protein [Planctomycetaceae bacterium]